jgi:hypothetical protein
MGFVIGNTDGIKFVLTDEGKRTLLDGGLFDGIQFFSIHDDEIIYTVDTSPKVVGVNGSKGDTTLVNKTAYKQNLT